MHVVSTRHSAAAPPTLYTLQAVVAGRNFLLENINWKLHQGRRLASFKDNIVALKEMDLCNRKNISEKNSFATKDARNAGITI